MGRSFRETITAKLRQAYKPKAVPRAGAALPGNGHHANTHSVRERVPGPCPHASFFIPRACGNNGSACGEKKGRTYFKIPRTYFEIGQTYFGIHQTYFLPPLKPHENPLGKYRQRQITFQPASDHAFSCRPHASPRGKNILTKPTHIARRALTGCMLRLHIQLCKHLNFFLFLVAC